MKFTIIYIAAIILCGLMEELPAQRAGIKANSIKNLTESAMPVARTQWIGKKRIYTALAKKGFTFAYKNGKVFYMDSESAKKYGARCFSKSIDALKHAATEGFKRSKGL